MSLHHMQQMLLIELDGNGAAVVSCIYLNWYYHHYLVLHQYPLHIYDNKTYKFYLFIQQPCIDICWVIGGLNVI